MFYVNLVSAIGGLCLIPVSAPIEIPGTSAALWFGALAASRIERAS